MGTGSFPDIRGGQFDLIPPSGGGQPSPQTSGDTGILGRQGKAFGPPPPRGDGQFPTMNELLQQDVFDKPGAATEQFFLFIAQQGGIADLDSSEQAQAFMAFSADILFPDPSGGTGAAGRTQFESERLLDLANVQLAEERARSEAFAREESRQRAGSEAFNRVKSKMDLLNLTDQLADARRESAVDSLIAALPFMVNPGTEFTPGFEPFGVGQELGSLLGANVPTQQLPTAQLPLQELANPLLALQPESISEGLDPLLTAPGTPQIPGV